MLGYRRALQRDTRIICPFCGEPFNQDAVYCRSHKCVLVHGAPLEWYIRIPMVFALLGVALFCWVSLLPIHNIQELYSKLLGIAPLLPYLYSFAGIGALVGLIITRLSVGGPSRYWVLPSSRV